MAKKDSFNFDTESKLSFKFGAGKSLTKKQREILLISIIAIVVVAFVVAAIVLISALNGGSGLGGNILGGGGNAGNESSSGGENDGDEVPPGEVDLNADPAQVYISIPPTKTTYYVGDSTPNYSGLVVSVMEKDSSEFKLLYDEYSEVLTITGFDSSEPVEKQEITVKYKDYTTSFFIEIKERVVTPELVSIRVDPLPIKTEYTLDETIDLTGGRVVCEYSDGSTRTLRFGRDNGVSYSGFASITTLGEHEITVEYYDEFGGYAKTTFTITMVE